MKYHSYANTLAVLVSRLREPAPGHVQILFGPRQVGKTHLLRELEKTSGLSGIYAAADVPEASRPGWWEDLWRQARERARWDKPGLLLIDEIQHLPDWGRRLKVEYDRLQANKTPLHVVVSGSSSLKLGKGARETMAGRFERVPLLHWPPSELARQFSLDKEKTLGIAVAHGTFPGAIPFLEQPQRWRNYVRDAIVEPAIGRDILQLEMVRRPALLRQLLFLAAGHPAEVISLQKLRGQLQDPGAIETVAHYLHVLEEAFLVAALNKYSPRVLRRRAAPPKLVVLNQGILAALTSEPATDQSNSGVTRGRWIENACIAAAWNAGQEVSYWRNEPYEVDMIIAGSWGHWAVEVKTGGYTIKDLAGLFEFCSRYKQFRPLLLCDRGREQTALEARLACISWQDFLFDGPPDEK